MGIQKNIGKNTIGDNNKMNVYMHDYNMSTHDLSTITRTTVSPGVLVPTMKLLVQKGDTLHIDIESNVLTHPTVGPLFGSFKLENHLYFAPMRLYNSWLHNNRTKIGLDMNQIKLPQIRFNITTNYDKPTMEDQWTQINPSSLMAYLGIKGLASMNGEGYNKNVEKNGVPILIYYDIFKNYYANTQEEGFYTIGVTRALSYINDKTSGKFWTIPLKQSINMAEGDVYEIRSYDNVEEFLKTDITYTIQGSSEHVNDVFETIAENVSISSGVITFTVNFQKEIGNIGSINIIKIQKRNEANLEKHDLENLDNYRDNILEKKGNTTLILDSNWDTPIGNLVRRDPVSQKLNTSFPQYGLCLKTYNSDLFQNWINTEWIDGITGINEISSVDVTDGKLSMDALNLAQKVYNMLNRIAVSGGTYRDWLETVYTGSNYFERCETPIFEGGTSQEIVFQEVISNSATEEEPLGTLAGRGVTTGKTRGGHIKVKVTEPGYIMCISSITPRIDYSQGNDWDTYLKTMDDLHKPAMDGIGYQDSLNGERAWWADYTTQAKDTITKTAAGKTVAWINYMTNINRTFGNFASGMSEEFMVLNRSYSPVDRGGGELNIEDLTTYIDPVKYNYIFADTSLDAMNFWLQIKFDIKARRLISAKQIPNL